MLPESRRVARLLLTHPTKEQWFEALKLDNILQKKTPATARRQARLIRNRLDTLEDEAWSLIADGSQEVATQLLFAAAIKHSRVLADFLRDVYAGHLRRLEQNISPAKDWEAFLAECVQRDPEIANLSNSTTAKMLQVILQSSCGRAVCRFHQDPAADATPSSPRCRALPQASWRIQRALDHGHDAMSQTFNERLNQILAEADLFGPADQSGARQRNRLLDF
jgi:hypothetical protein